MRRSRRIWLSCFILLGAAPGLVVAQAPRRGPATSAYTPLDLDRCTRIGPGEEESDTWRCPGYGGIPLFVGYGDLRFDVDAGEDNHVWESHAAPNTLPDRVEWRLRGGRPRAIIYRLRLTDAEGRAGRSLLGVETISRAGEWAGCLVAWIDGDVPNANAVARRYADRDHQSFQCGHSEPEVVIRQRR